MLRALRYYLPAVLCVLLPLLDLLWNLTHLNVGLPDFYGLALAARALAVNGAWPQTPYFPVLYPLLLVPFGLLGSVLAGGYVLSCAGLTLTLFAVRRLWLVLSSGHRAVEMLTGDKRVAATGEDGGAVAAATLILLAWLMPVWRVAAGSPSVDALYTGLGLWFIAAAVATWRLTAARPGVETTPSAPEAAAFQPPITQAGQLAGDKSVAATGNQPATRMSPLQENRVWSALPKRIGIPIVVILWLTAFLLPLLRYHAVILVVPIALLLFRRIRGRWTALAILKAGLLAVVFNYLGYVIANGEQLPSVAALQVRCGIEFAQHTHYPTPDALWDDYANFADHARETPLLEDYTVGQLATHVSRNYTMFLRQPAIALALILLIGGYVMHRRGGSTALPVGSGLLALWLLLYCLSLSAAYYTARAALLPALVGLALVLALAARLGRIGQLLCIGVLLIGYELAGLFAVHDFMARLNAARKSTEILKTYDSAPAYENPLIIRRRKNPWCEPYLTKHGSWLDDPAIPPILIEGRELLDPNYMQL